MSRLAKYRESIERFMKNNKHLNESKINIEDYFKNSDFFLPIVLLTTLNSQNKKFHVSTQGYQVASSIVIINILMDNSFSTENTIFLLSCVTKLLKDNLDNVKDVVPSKKIGGIFVNALKIYNDYLFSKIVLPRDNYIETQDGELNDEVSKWYLKDDSIIESFNNVLPISPESFDIFLKNTICSLCNIVFGLGWILGCGDELKLDKIEKISNNFGIIYKLSHDFENLDHDSKHFHSLSSNQDSGKQVSGKQVSYNFIINYGFDKAYEKFMDSKYKLIEELMNLDINTSTIKEIINSIEHKVDLVIDETSPDIKSNYSRL